MTITVQRLHRVIDEIAPFRLAESWDNVGIQIGHPSALATPLIVALEVNRALLNEIDKTGARCIVTHHPLLFRPPKNLQPIGYANELAVELIRRDVALIAAHTNYDSIFDGTNGELADRLALRADKRRFLRPASPVPNAVKYAVFVPATHIAQVIEAIASAGAAVIGQYSHCTFRTPGTGTFKPLPGASPSFGSVGKLEEATDEVKLECVCPKDRIGDLLAAVRRVHPYEEIAFDLYTLEPPRQAEFGLGIVGELETETTLDGLANRAAASIGSRLVSLVGDPATPVRRVALCSGAGGDFVRNWREGTADVFVTGEMNHHDALEAEHRGLPVLLVGHWESEVIAMPRLAAQIAARLGASIGGDVLVSEGAGQGPIRRY